MALVTREQMEDVINSGNGPVLFNGKRYFTVESLPTQEEIDASYYVGTEGPQGEQGEQGIQGEQGEQGIQGIPGEDGQDGINFIFQGAWDSGTTYDTPDVVRYDGSLWYALQESTNVTPTESASWSLAVQKGAAGEQGIQGIQGEQGEQGEQGIQGDAGNDGADGNTWTSGSGVPSNGVGANGDHYLDTVTGDVYLKSGGTYSVVTNIMGPAGSSPMLNIQTFTSSGTWTKPSGVTSVQVIAIGAGSGGDSGLYVSGGTIGATFRGSKGGAGGGLVQKTFLASALGATETVTIGAGGAGGARNGSTGTKGASGGATTFGSHLTANGGTQYAGAWSEQGSAHTGGTTSGATGTPTPNTIYISGSEEGAETGADGPLGTTAATAIPGISKMYAGPSGGCGGSITGTTTGNAGGNGGGNRTTTAGASAALGGAANGGNGTNGANTGWWGIGEGGGGGGTRSSSGFAGNGGNGGIGAGGGGGGHGISAATAGGCAGGNGGNGKVVVYSW